MSRNRLLVGELLALLAMAWGPSLASAQAAASAPDARLEAQDGAFLTTPEPGRKATREALCWFGLDNGAVEGIVGLTEFGALARVVCRS